MQSSNAVETHYFPAMTSSNRRILLHSHLSAPFVDHSVHVMNLTIYSSGELQCLQSLKALDISIDIPASLVRCSSRYLNGIVSWGIGVVSIIIFLAWRKEDFGRKHSITLGEVILICIIGPLPSLGKMIGEYIQVLFYYLLPASFLLSFVPLPKSLYLGNAGIAIFSPLAPLILTITSGLVVLSWWILYSLLCIVGCAQNLLRIRSVSVTIFLTLLILLQPSCNRAGTRRKFGVFPNRLPRHLLSYPVAGCLSWMLGDIYVQLCISAGRCNS